MWMIIQKGHSHQVNSDGDQTRGSIHLALLGIQNCTQKLVLGCPAQISIFNLLLSTRASCIFFPYSFFSIQVGLTS